jgi:Zn-dependent M16 (insulinase) family peptidase
LTGGRHYSHFTPIGIPICKDARCLRCISSLLCSANISPSDLERCIIGTIGEIEPYRLPVAKGFAAMQRHLLADTNAVRGRVREEVLSTTVADVLPSPASRARWLGANA